MSFKEAKAIVMVLSPEDRLGWYAYREGWADWKLLKECVELVTFSRVGHSTVTYEVPPSPMTPTKIEGHDLSSELESTDPSDVDKSIVYEGESDDLSTSESMKEHQAQETVVGESQQIEPQDEEMANEEVANDEVANAKDSAAEIEPEVEGLSVQKTEEVTRTAAAQTSISRTDIVEPIEFKDDVTELSKRSKIDPSILNTSDEDEALEHMRRFKRYNVRLHIEVIGSQQRFTSFTVDVSLGGIQIEESIPDWVAGYCTVMISTLDLENRLEFMCSIVENQEGERTRLEIYPSSDTVTLREWLENGTPQAKKAS